jgi:hypothetical protein
LNLKLAFAFGESAERPQISNPVDESLS